jgi:DNA-binding transcriptional regulator YdaS (Cro superfamily)
MTPGEALNEAIDAIGGPQRTAELMGVTHSAVYLWRLKRLPAERVLALEEACERKITRYQLRPDIYPR